MVKDEDNLRIFCEKCDRIKLIFISTKILDITHKALIGIFNENTFCL